ncbi:MAG: universal stress protein [Rhodospirillales bacterium]|nr:universal stress protein [Rhodospirillales bacterium]
MTIRTILVPHDGSNAAKPIMEAGLAFGKALGAHVEILLIRSDPKDTIPLLGEGMSVTMIEDMIQISENEGKDRAAEGRKAFDELVEKLSIKVADKPTGNEASAAWSEEVGREDEITARLGRLADLTVAGRPTANSDVSSTLTLNAALFDTGRPVLVVPDGGAVDFGKHVAISWNGSAQSARAVSSAMPLIAAANKVTVLTAGSDRTSSAVASELVGYLEWHGVKADAKTFPASSQQSIGEKLLAECGEEGADLLVMGAYTHSRMRQLILGGVTRHVLEESKLPLFMAH